MLEADEELYVEMALAHKLRITLKDIRQMSCFEFAAWPIFLEMWETETKKAAEKRADPGGHILDHNGAPFNIPIA